MTVNKKKRYNDYSSYIKSKFNQRIQKISLDTGFTCPNRDGTKGIGGCTYCNNSSFSPHYCSPKKTIKEQLEEGILFFSKKYKTQKYLAYFQSYTNTYSGIETLKKMYSEATDHPNIIGIVIGTRPDCIDNSIISFLSELSKTKYVSLEFGIESTIDRTLKLINRCHTFEDTIHAFKISKNKGIMLGAHLILGLPEENEEDMIEHAKKISLLPINTLKIHQLQILKNTMMAIQYKKESSKFNLLSLEKYIPLVCKFVCYLRPDIIIDRFVAESPKEILIAPQWNGIKNFEIVILINNYLTENNLWQGKYYKKQKF